MVRANQDKWAPMPSRTKKISQKLGSDNTLSSRMCIQQLW